MPTNTCACAQLTRPTPRAAATASCRMSFIFALLVSDDSLLTASNDCIVVRQSEPRIRNTPAAAPRQYGLFEPVAAHFRLILRAYDLVHRRTVLSFLTHPDRTPQPWRRSGAISE